MIATLGVFAALSIVFALLIRFPLFPAAAFLEYSPSDVPIYLVSFMYGPVCGLVLTLVVSFIQGFTVSAASGIIGVAMNFLSTGSYCLVAGLIYKKHRTFKGALVGLGIGSITYVGLMLALNVLLTPIYMGVAREVVVSMLATVILPFNLIKVVINSILTLCLYKKTKQLVGFVWKKADAALKKRKDAKENNAKPANEYSDQITEKSENTADENVDNEANKDE